MSYYDNYGADIFADDDKLALTKRGKPRKRKPKEPRIYFTQDTEDAKYSTIASSNQKNLVFTFLKILKTLLLNI